MNTKLALVVVALLWTAVSNTAVPLPQANSRPFRLPEGQQFSNPGRQLLAVSHDGAQSVYVANNRLYLKRSGEPQPTVIQGTEMALGGLTNPVFSPDGRSVVFWASVDQTFKRIAVSGGTPTTISKADNPFGMSWGANDQIVFGQGPKGVMRVSGSGGTPETIVTMKDAEYAHGPQILPGGDAVLFTLATVPKVVNTPAEIWDNAKIVVHSLSSGVRKTLVEGGSDGRFVPTGHIVYAIGEKALAVPFDIKRLEVTGKPFTVLENVRRAGATGTAQFSFSESGALAYLTTPQFPVAFVDLKGAQKPAGFVPGSTFALRISPNGKQIALDTTDNIIWVSELSNSSPMRRITPNGYHRYPMWSGDGQRLFFVSNRDGQPAIYWQPADGSGTAERLTQISRAPESWSAENQILSFITLKSENNTADYDVWGYSFKDKKVVPIVETPASAQHSSTFSPDGRWIAYVSDETKTFEVFVQPFPQTGAKFQVTKGGGEHPLWSPDGETLYYDNAGRMFSVPIRTQPAFTAGDPSTLPINGFIQAYPNNRRQYDITADGKQFLMMFPPAQQVEEVSNWFDELKRRSRAQ